MYATVMVYMCVEYVYDSYFYEYVIKNYLYYITSKLLLSRFFNNITNFLRFVLPVQVTFSMSILFHLNMHVPESPSGSGTRKLCLHSQGSTEGKDLIHLITRFCLVHNPVLLILLLRIQTTERWLKCAQENRIRPES